MKSKFILVMGVSGCGKTTVGKELATRLGWPFYDADEFHTPENIAKMRNGVPLTDGDRIPWLEVLHKLILGHTEENMPGVLACSALKEHYRRVLLQGIEGVVIVYLVGSYELIWSRMADRSEHYMKPQMLRSQFEALEVPKNALNIDASLTVEEIVARIIDNLKFT